MSYVIPPQLARRPCPCRALAPDTEPDGTLTYGACCGRWHGDEPAPTPQALMRSRFTAYTLLREKAPVGVTMHGYLLRTWHPSSSPADLEPALVRWTGLQVLDDAEHGDTGVVEFVAHYKNNGRADKLHEISRFIREAGHWYYIDGTQP
jgi:SEC-C motif domain protein